MSDPLVSLFEKAYQQHVDKHEPRGMPKPKTNQPGTQIIQIKAPQLPSTTQSPKSKIPFFSIPKTNTKKVGKTPRMFSRISPKKTKGSDFKLDNETKQMLENIRQQSMRERRFNEEQRQKAILIQSFFRGRIAKKRRLEELQKLEASSDRAKEYSDSDEETNNIEDLSNQMENMSVQESDDEKEVFHDALDEPDDQNTQRSLEDTISSQLDQFQRQKGVLTLKAQTLFEFKKNNPLLSDEIIQKLVEKHQLRDQYRRIVTQSKTQ